MANLTTTGETMNLIEAQNRIIERQKAQFEARAIGMLETEAGQADYIKSVDTTKLKSIADRIGVAYNKDLACGYQFNEPIEYLVAIARALQYAKKEVRELLQPSDENDADLYLLFDRDTRDELISAYGSLPYAREATTLVMPDGTVQVLDQDLVDEARKGKPCDVARLNSAIEKTALRIGLLGQYTATQEKADEEFTSAQRKVAKLATLNSYKTQLA